MIPADLPPRLLRLPDGPRTMVVVTGPALRHERFARRLRAEFGTLVVAWYQVSTPNATSSASAPTAARRARRWRLRRRALAAGASLPETEEAMFGDEVRRLRAVAPVAPRSVVDPNAPDVVAEIDALAPYLIVTLGGAVYGDALLACARGLAINQHSGWCPTYRGADTVEWTLYRRDLSHLGSTVHVMTSGLDAGPVLRRSTACITSGDTVASCFARVVALGTELMCEVIADIVRSDQITVHDQADAVGRSYIGREMTSAVRRLIDEDLRRGMLRVELARARDF